MAVIRNPTYMEHIRHFFEEEDHDCMFHRGKDYTTYDSLKAAAIEVYSITKPPNATMPEPVARRWDADKSQSFLNWITNDFPRGKAKPKKPRKGNVARVRKSLSELSTAEVNKVKLAFEGMMARDVDDPEGYFQIAAVHWFPNQPPPHAAYCQHHTAHYHMWHRAYLLRFENAMRTVPGCESVTLPYWDFTETLPAWTNLSPFKSYKLPEEVHRDYPEGHTTKRLTPNQIARQFSNRGVNEMIDDALTQPSWEAFNNAIEGAHDQGHPSCGPSLAFPDIASFDPVFWFFHSNWDRLWWRWQQMMQATTLWKFRSTFSEPDTALFLTPPLNQMRPNFMTADKTVDSHELGVTYTQPQAPEPEVLTERFGHVPAIRHFRASDEPVTSVRVRGIDRLAIPGSFQVDLLANGKSLAQRCFFQSTEPNDCPTCRENAKINIDFKVPIQKVLGTELSVKIEVFGRDGKTRAFPISSAGDPTINARLLLEH